MDDEATDLADIIQRVAQSHSGKDARTILREASHYAAALMSGIVTGEIPSKMADRVRTAVNILDRVEGTPVSSADNEDRKKAEEMLARIAKLESNRPPRPSISLN